jgi:hypothetical protein
LRVGGGGGSGGGGGALCGDRWAEWHEATNTFKGIKQGEEDRDDDMYKVVLLRVPRAEAGEAACDGRAQGGAGEGGSEEQKDSKKTQ